MPPINGIVKGMEVTVDQATVDSAQVRAFIKLHIRNPNSNIVFYSREAEYDRDVAGGETVPQFAARVAATEKALRDAAILSHLSKLQSATDITAQLGGLVAP